MTQADLGRATSISQPMIAHIEQGLKQSSLGLEEKIATATSVKLDFLYRPSGPALPFESMLFRARADVSARKFAQTHAIATNIFEIFLHIEV
jgi:transcriptional regulator with XRE-family HTH domain